MLSKSIKSKLFLLILFTFVSFLIISSVAEIFLVSKFFNYSNALKVDQLESKIKKDIKDIESYEELENYLFDLSYSENVYITLYDIVDHEIVWQYLTDENIVKVKKKDGISEKMFPVQTVFGTYNLNILSYTQFNAYIQDTMISILPFNFILVAISVLVITIAMMKMLANPIVDISNNLNEYIESGEEKYPKPLKNGVDEISKIDNNIYQLANLYEESQRELAGDEVLKEEKSNIRRENLAIVSHELKTPLTVLKLQTECMINNIGDYSDRDKYLERNLDIIHKIEGLVGSILGSLEVNYQKLEISDEEQSIDEIIREEMNNMSILIEEKNLKVDYEMSKVNLHIDIKFFTKALKNILENAIKYSEKNETIRIILDADHLEVININHEVTNKELKNIFDPFKRVDKSRGSETGGSGIGLYIVSQALKKHGFDYSIEVIKNKVIFQVLF